MRRQKPGVSCLLKTGICRTLPLVLLPLLVAGCGQEREQPKAEQTVFAMNTYVTMTAYGEQAQTALEEAAQSLQRWESLWSVTEEGSEIYRTNHSGGQSVPVSPETQELVSFALSMAQETKGALEPTLYPLLRAWGFTNGSRQVPQESEIRELLQAVDYRRITVEEGELTVPDGMQIDLGSVAKGYAADKIAGLLREYGVSSAILSLGGNVQAVGSRPDGTDWRIAVQAPWEQGTLGILEISDAAVVTSGGYENYFSDEEGYLYWHILDPATGYPADSGLQSVTIVGKEGRVCDALSTACFVMGQEALAYWRADGSFDMLLVTEDGEIIVTEGIAERFTPGEDRTEHVEVVRR
ncbi:MAG: FAD:protein FMN transferase [Eubacteriales bacterium]|nr:FAD:protein FMN transferase [Eubacteriales bacterium]